MTREEAIEILSRPKSMKGVPAEILTAHAMAIKALEQEPILDKIRAEIEQMIAESEKAIRPFDGMEVVIYTKGFKDGVGSAIDVIDKYKAESEDKE